MVLKQFVRTTIKKPENIFLDFQAFFMIKSIILGSFIPILK